MFHVFIVLIIFLFLVSCGKEIIEAESMLGINIAEISETLNLDLNKINIDEPKVVNFWSHISKSI